MLMPCCHGGTHLQARPWTAPPSCLRPSHTSPLPSTLMHILTWLLPPPSRDPALWFSLLPPSLPRGRPGHSFCPWHGVWHWPQVCAAVSRLVNVQLPLWTVTPQGGACRPHLSSQYLAESPPMVEFDETTPSERKKKCPSLLCRINSEVRAADPAILRAGPHYGGTWGRHWRRLPVEVSSAHQLQSPIDQGVAPELQP